MIIHEEGEAGHEMPDLERPVQAVSKAVANLAKVGREMVHSTDDTILRQDMPVAITKVENAATLLEDASNLSKTDPYSNFLDYYSDFGDKISMYLFLMVDDPA